MIHKLSSVACALALTGCASIFNGQTQAISFQSEPAGASITVTNPAGEQVHSGGMYVFPDTVSATLEAASAPSASVTPSLKLVSMDSLAPEVRAQGRLVAVAR